MNKMSLTLFGLLISLGVYAQDFTAYQAYQIREGIQLEIKDIKKVAKYGWDNLEITYTVTNETDFDIHKLDFNIHLIDNHNQAIGTVEAHAFSLPKHSEEERHYTDAKTEFGSAKIKKEIGEIVQMDVYVDKDSLTVASIKTVAEIIQD
ncbi:hypothetical protein [Reichenbachiella versicolor]|uniref:hypothetical protein n=1 Tax=Reichenbachiella versicolor TaxID=1821036 RepID=UPI0013A5625D|nr:hypothetical protein [Reichenbachiella versicolor]